MPLDPKEVFERLDGTAFIRELYPETGPPDQSSEVRILCPFHDDAPHPSGTFNISTKLFRCFSCDAKGDAASLLAQAQKVTRRLALEYLARKVGVQTSATISSQLVETWHHSLRISAPILEELWRRQGVDVTSVERWRLGWKHKEQRLTIPVRDETGAVVNVRQYDLLKVHDEKKKFLNVRGHGQLRLFPIEALNASAVVITEGELKAIGLVQRGVNAISVTGGAAGWKDSWDVLFKDKQLWICYDVDDTGRARSRALARRLVRHAKEVRLIQLPLDRSKHPHGDVNDYFVKDGYQPQDFTNLMVGTEPWTPVSEPVGINDDTVYEVSLGSASKSQYFMHRVRTPVIVSAKDTAPYIIPKDVQVNCSRDLEVCPSCPVWAQPEDATWTVEADDPDALRLIDVPTKIQEKELKEMVGIPTKCTLSEVVVTDTHNLEEIRLVPQLDTSGSSPTYGEQTVARAYYVGHGIETNATYSLKARVSAHPKTQHATLLAYEAEPNVDSLTSFEPAKEELDALSVFQPAEWTDAALEAKLADIYEDLELNVTRVYQRRPLHQLMDLVWHSVLYITLTEEPQKGWVDALVIGDTGQGKSETATRLLKHYGLGERVDMKGASVAGLKGGLQDTQSRWFVTWGVIPLNDRRLVVLEEVKGCPPEVLQALTDMRSSGVAELVKIERRRAWARTRLLWISNPRSDRKIETYAFGVFAIKELVGSLEDVRRFDAALVVASNEVPPEVIAKSIRSSARPHVYTSELCRRLLLWTWSRRHDQVEFTSDAKEACFDLALQQSSRYSSAIPLVEPADHRLKLARLAASLAARTFSTDESRQKLLVRACHVQRVVKFLDDLYASRFLGYRDYSEVQKLDSEMTSADDIKAALLEVPFPLETIRGFVRTTEIRQSDVVDWSALDKEAARDLVSLLVRNNALTRRYSNYYKTGAFIEFLKKLEVGPSVPDHVQRVKRDY